MRTEPPSLCLGCGRAACKGCVTLGVDRRRQAVLVLTPVVAVVASKYPRGERKRLRLYSESSSARIITHIARWVILMYVVLGTGFPENTVSVFVNCKVN
jgi:ribosomal protein L30E